MFKRCEKMNTKAKNLISIFFLILFCNNVFAFGIDFNRFNEKEEIYFADARKVVFDRGNGCSTVELPESSVNALWKEILTKGFSADEITSDQGPNLNRQTLDQNAVLLTEPNAKAGDIAVKQEMPSKIMKPIETPTLLGQVCYGPYGFGVNLKDTLRIGRCTGQSEDSECYVTNPGLFRQNGINGFFRKSKVVVSDLWVGLKEMVRTDADQNALIKEDLGPFSNITSTDIQHYLQAMEANDMNAMETEMWTTIQDKSIQNATMTNNFSVSMQTTCRGENCYINTYSLFDKMFNQYFSLDMVYSATTPFLYNGMARIANHPSIKRGLTAVPERLKAKGIIKEGGFIDTLTKDPALFIKDPFGRIGKAFDARRHMKGDVDTFIRHKLEGLDVIRRDIESNHIKEFSTDMFKATQGTPGDARDFALRKIINNDKAETVLKLHQKRAATDVAEMFGNKINSANALLKSKMATDDFKNAKAIIDEVTSQNLPITEAYARLTREQLEAYTDTAYTASRLADAYDIATFKEFKWKAGYENSGLVTGRSFERFDDLTIYRYKDGKTTGRLLEVDPKSNKPIFGDDFDAFRYEKSGDFYTLKGAKNLQTQTVTVRTGTDNIQVNRIRAVVEAPDPTNVVSIQNFNEVTAFASNPLNQNGYIQYFDNTTRQYKTIRTIDWGDGSKYAGIASDISGYPKSTVTFVDDYVDPVTGRTIKEIYGKGAFDLDPLETMKQVIDNVPNKINNTAKNYNEIFTSLSNMEWVSGRGRDALNQYMKVYNGASFQRFFTRSPMVFGVNFLYWQAVSGAGTTLGEVTGLKKYSIYRLPENYSAFHIKHHETAKIYEDAYVDFFANDGSDEGDLFKSFLNSGLFWSAWLLKNVSASVSSEWSKSFNNFMRNVTEGKIRRSKVDDIVLITDNIRSGCTDRCQYVIGPEYIDRDTRNASLLMETEMVVPEEENIDMAKIAIDEANTSKDNTNPNANSSQDNTDPKETDTDSQSQPKPKQNYLPNISLNEIKIITSTPPEITTTNYILENTSEENLKKHGQTLITFSHHTDYDGTFSNQTTDKAVNLVEAVERGETCNQKIDMLNLMGVPIGKAIPESFTNYRLAAVLNFQQHLSYLVFPGAGYMSTFLGPALISTVPQMFVIMPELNGCVDDAEGTYAHFFVSSAELERVANDSKNKVGEAVKEGTKKVEEALSKVTSGTELEKGIKFGSEQIQQFADQKLQENPIVQATYKTSGRTDTSLIAQMFFFEMGARTKCSAIGNIDKGVENLIDKDTKISLTIDKEKGEMSVVDANGNKKIIIDKENKDFVRLIATNLGIPAKIVPRSLSYIPIPDNTEPLFEIDSFGNLSIKNSEFFDCLRAGYEAQTGLTMSANANNVTKYLGAVKLANTVHPSTQYLIKPQGDRIMADGTPRMITNGSNSKVTILGNRITKIGPIDTREMTIGQNVAIQLDNAHLIYVEEKRAYIMWVETTTITHGNDIDKLKTELVSEKATNGCPDTDEIALNFSVTPQRDNDQAKLNTDKLNKALEKVGPFQMFDTPTKTFIFYVSDPPECEQRLKIIDKVTGEVTDQKITSVQQTPNGLIVKTDDGKTHELTFSSEEGVPKLTYNKDKETLISAQGKNGAFWYDPETGNWHTTNGNLIPFNDKFKEGITFAVNPNGQVTGNPSNNVFNIGSGDGRASGGGFNISLAPENKALFMLYICMILLGFMFIYSRKK